MRELLMWTCSRGTVSSIRLCGLIFGEQPNTWSQYFKEKYVPNHTDVDTYFASLERKNESGMLPRFLPRQMLRLIHICARMRIRHVGPRRMRTNAKELLIQHSPHKRTSKRYAGYLLASRTGLVSQKIVGSGEVYVQISMIANSDVDISIFCTYRFISIINYKISIFFKLIFYILSEKREAP